MLSFGLGDGADPEIGGFMIHTLNSLAQRHLDSKRRVMLLST